MQNTPPERHNSVEAILFGLIYRISEASCLAGWQQGNYKLHSIIVTG